jgi:hypothetical protein
VSLGGGIAAALLFQLALGSPQAASAALANGLTLAWFGGRVSILERAAAPFLIGALALLASRWLAGALP